MTTREIGLQRAIINRARNAEEITCQERWDALAALDREEERRAAVEANLEALRGLQPGDKVVLTTGRVLECWDGSGPEDRFVAALNLNAAKHMEMAEDMIRGGAKVVKANV